MKRHALIPIFLIVLVDMLAMMMIVPLLPFYAERFGANPIEIGFLASSFAIFQLFASPFLGSLSDRIGRKPVLILSQAGTFLGFILMASASSLWMLFVARIVDGITAGNLPIAQACIADVTEPGDRARAFGIIGVAFGLGLVLGPAVSGLLAAKSLLYPVYAAAGLSALSMLVTFFLLPDVRAAGATERARVSDFFQRSTLAPLLFQFLLFVFVFAYFAQNLALFCQGRFGFGPTEVGYAFAYCGVLGVLIQGVLMGRLVRVFGESRLVKMAFLADILGYGLLGFSGSLPMLYLSCTLFSIGNSTLRPVLTSLITQRVSKNEQGAVLGLTGSLQSFGQVVAPPIGAIFIQQEMLTLWVLCWRLFAFSHSCRFDRGK